MIYIYFTTVKNSWEMEAIEMFKAFFFWRGGRWLLANCCPISDQQTVETASLGSACEGRAWSEVPSFFLGSEASAVLLCPLLPTQHLPHREPPCLTSGYFSK